mmetsp:Transcript_41582/g.36968  ORF Transcript_41582/g.36968 Transcript_41582/m.36968 type:complete len:316 (+) Transcript_41582:98-1045(+)
MNSIKTQSGPSNQETKPMAPSKPRPRSQKDDFSGLKVTDVINQSKFVVYKAESPKSKKKFAMKVFPYKDGKINSCFHKESRFMGLLHKNIIAIHDVNPERTSICKEKLTTVSYIVMEYAPYGDLADFLMSPNYPNDATLARTLFHEIVEGVEYIHKKGIAHLDLKPENMLISEDFGIKITDFDAAIDIEKDDSIGPVGTKNYRAPEIINKEDSVDPFAADIFSLGVILFLLKASIFPYCEESKINEKQLLDYIKKGDKEFWKLHPAVNEAPEAFSDDFKELFFGMTAGDPTKRYTLADIKKSKWYNKPIYKPHVL